MRPRHVAGFLGVLGWPLQGSLSPVIHNAALRNLGIDWIYLHWPVHPDHLAAAVAGIRALGALGGNVTMPHKESVIAHLDQISGDAHAVGAVNTIQRVGDRLIGHNTDVDGFREFLLADAGVDVAGRSALILGAGGAARAAVKALSDLGSAEIVIGARRTEQGENLVPLGQGKARAVSWDEAAGRAASFDVIVNATPLADPLPDGAFRAGQIVVDLVYRPPATVLVERAKRAGADAWGGLGMLVHQAASSFRIWTGQEPPLEVMSAAALHAVLKR